MSSLPSQLRQIAGDIANVVSSRQKASELLKTLSLVVPVTILIWIYAERAQVVEDKIPLVIDVTTVDPSQSAELANDADPGIELDVEGPRSRIEYLKDELNRASREGRLRVPIPSGYQPGTEPTIQVASLLNDFTLITQSGVTVKSASPAVIKVKIDAVADRTVPVLMPKTSYNILNPVFEPASVKITGPKRVLETLFPTPEAGVSVDLRGFTDRINGPGSYTFKGVPVTANDPRIKIVPASLSNVRFEVAASDREITIPAIPIEIRKPVKLEGKVTVTLQKLTVTNVKVRGPEASIQRVEARNDQPPAMTPIAVLRISEEDGMQRDIRRAVEITNLPTGVTVVGNPPEVEFSVTYTEPTGG